MDKKDNANGISRKDIAMQNFLKGYNCTQSVLLAFELSRQPHGYFSLW